MKIKPEGYLILSALCALSVYILIRCSVISNAKLKAGLAATPSGGEVLHVCLISNNGSVIRDPQIYFCESKL